MKWERYFGRMKNGIIWEMNLEIWDINELKDEWIFGKTPDMQIVIIG